MKCPSCKKVIPSASVNCPFCNTKIDESTINFGNIDNIDYTSITDLKSNAKEPLTKKKKLIIVGMCAFVFFIFAMLILTMIMPHNNTSYYKYYTGVIDEITDYFLDNYTSSESVHSGKYDLSLKINNIEKIIDGTYSFDIPNKTIYLNNTIQDPIKNNETIVISNNDIKLESYMENNEIYLTSSSFFDNTILFSYEDNEGFLKNKYDMASLIDSVRETLDASLKNLKYVATNESIDFHGDNKNTEKITLTLDGANKTEFIKNIYENLLDDTNFLNEYAKIKGVKSSEIQTTIENLKTNAQYKYLNSTDSIEISIYHVGSKVYRITYNDTKNKLVLDIGEVKYYVNYYKNSQSVFSMTLVKNTKEHENYNEISYDIEGEYEKNTFEINLEFETDTKSTLQKKSYESPSNYMKLSEEEYNSLKTKIKDNLKLIKPTIVDKLRKKFVTNCSKVENCTCDQDKKTCSCINPFDSKTFITCDITDVNEKVIGNNETTTSQVITTTITTTKQ